MLEAAIATARDTAKLKPNELAKLLKVSRVTVSRWYNGHAEPHPLLTDRVTKLLDAVTAAVEAGELPVPATVSRRERGYYISKTLTKHLLIGAQAKAAGNT